MPDLHHSTPLPTIVRRQLRPHLLCLALLSAFSGALPLAYAQSSQNPPLRPPTSSPAATGLTAPKPSAVSAPVQAAAPVAVNTQAIKFTPSAAAIAQLRNLPANALVELSNGRKVEARRVVAMADALKGLSSKKANLKRMDFAFTRPTGPAQVKLTSANLASARSMAPGTVLELPNGLKLTSGELRKLEALEARTNIRQMLGGQAPSAGAAGGAANKYAGQPAIKIKGKADIAQLKGKPDSTIVEAPDGSRTTLGELKAAIVDKFVTR